MSLAVQNVGWVERDSRAQSNFRAALLAHLKGTRSDTTRQATWCPFTSAYWHTIHMKTAHIFRYAHSQAVMTSIFGHSTEPELFSPRNGTLMSDLAEERYDKGYFVIVLNIPDIPRMRSLSID